MSTETVNVSAAGNTAQQSKATVFKITKTMIETYCQRGFTVPEMVADITKISGFKCTESVIQAAAKRFEIDLRKKSKKSPFVFEDDTEANDTAESGEQQVEGFRLS